jgi:hypothetical protein
MPFYFMNNVYDSQIPFGFRSITLVISREVWSRSQGTLILRS